MALNRQMSPHGRNGRPSFWERPSRALPDRKGARRGMKHSSSAGWPAVNNRQAKAIPSRLKSPAGLAGPLVEESKVGHVS